MRKLFAVVVLCVSFAGAAFGFEMESNPEVHKIIGGLYALGSAVSLHNSTKPSVEQIARYFRNAPYDGKSWNECVKISREKNSIWLGLLVDKFSNARSYLRTNADNLKLKDSPNGRAWLSGDFIWLKVAEISGKDLKPVRIDSCLGSGDDSEIVFLSVNGDSWWQANPEFTSQASRNVIKNFGVANAPELHAPKNNLVSIYDEVKPSSVRVPDEIHMRREKTFGDQYETHIGDVNFSPIPNVPRD